MRHNVKKLTLRLTAPEYAHLCTLSNASGLKLEPLIRKLIMGENLRPRPPDEYAPLLRELSAIGNNVNQIAYWSNARKSVAESEIREAAALVRQAWRLVKDTL